MDEMEALQTDVMRFIAILGLCLMVIFALVKSLPMVPPDDRPRIEDPESLSGEAERLGNRIRELRKVLTDLMAETEMARISWQTTTIQAEKAEKALERMVALIDSAGEELGKSEKRLINLQKEIDRREISLSRIRSKIQAEKRRLVDTEVSLKRARQTLLRDKTVREAPEKRPETNPAQPPQRVAKEGFTLRFDSDKALESLILKGVVGFYAMVGKNAWQLNFMEGGPRFDRSGRPRVFYEMEAGTVPASYGRAFRKAVAAFGPGSVVWAVTLPNSIRTSITSRTADLKSGDLVIKENGKVFLE